MILATGDVDDILIGNAYACLLYTSQRVRSGRAIDTENLKLYKLVKEEYPKVSECVDQIGECLLNQWQVQLSEEEELYLILHVNRICVKEGL